ncbi:unnamed protein product, partial [Brassicogethes aeneus]
SPDRNTTTSVLTFVPTVEDGGKYLSCRGQQHQIPDSGIEDGWKLDIYHVPMVNLELGSTLNGSTIKEGVDVYFECNIKSNPWVYKVTWRHNGKQLYNNAQTNTIVSNQSLVLQSITRARSGHYTCVGHNREGDGESNPIQLDVKFTPVCRPGQAKVFGVARQEVARIPCELEGNPTDIQFVWKFNNSAGTLDIPQSQVFTEKARSVVSYKPMTEYDYGKPDSLTNCTILNQTAESLHVECIEGFDGGLQQEFIMEVYDTQTRKLVSNVTSRNPVFTVGGLESGLGYDVGLYAANKKGRSGVSHLDAFTLKYYLRVYCKVSQVQRDFYSTYLMQVYEANSRVLIGTATSQTPEDITISNLPSGYGDLLLFVRTMDSKSITSDANIIYAPAVHFQTGGGERDDKDYDDGGLSSAGRRCVAANSDKASTEPLNKDLNDSVDSLEEKNPDIIPQNSAEDEYQDEERAFERLNNAPLRVYSRMQSPSSQPKNGCYDSYGKTVNMLCNSIYLLAYSSRCCSER